MMKSKAIVFAHLIFSIGSSWHAYDSRLADITNENCSTYHRDQTPHIIAPNQSIRLWPGLIREHDVSHGNSLYGFRTAVDMIWRHQHPSNCKTAKFLISNGWFGGFASVPHVEGVALAVALELGRILLPHPDGVIRGPPRNFGTKVDQGWQVDTRFCQEQGKRSLECYYEPWSSCTMEDALRGKHLNTYPELWLTENDVYAIQRSGNKSLPSSFKKRYSDFRTIIFTNIACPFHFIPTALRDIVDCSPMKKEFQYYWWRAVSATYMIRPNRRTLLELERYRTLRLNFSNEGCVAVHVRLGDKGAEMKLVPLKVYLSAAQRVWESGRMTRAPQQRTPVLIISSDDPDVYTNASRWGRRRGWRVLYTTLVDKSKLSSRLDYLRLAAARRSGVGLEHHELEYFSMLLNLDYALRCHAWVCPLQSNTCRLIDEMRATVGGKAASGVLVDVSTETCLNPPCIDGVGMMNVGW